MLFCGIKSPPCRCRGSGFRCSFPVGRPNGPDINRRRGQMGPQAGNAAKITSEMTLSEKADAIEEHMMHELDKIVTKSVFANMTDGHVDMEGGAALQK